MGKKILFLCITLFIITFFSLVSAQETKIEPYYEVLSMNNYSGVKYESKILTEFNKTSNVTVIVKVRDTSGIFVTGKELEEEQSIKDAHKKEFLLNKTDYVLSTLPETEFRLGDKFPKGDGFYGTITKKGFDRLLNDSYVGEIYLEIVAHITPVTSTDVEQKKQKPELEIIENKTNFENFSIIEEEKNPKFTDEVVSIHEMEETEKKTAFWLWISVLIFVITSTLFLMIKFRKR